MIDKAHKNGIICNVFWSDDEKEAKESGNYIEKGHEAILHLFEK